LTVSAQPCVLLVPGLLCDRWIWSAQIAALSRHADVIVPEVAHAPSITAMAQAALASVSGRFALAGHSLGGRIALEAIRLAPDRIEHLALLDCGVGPVKPTEVPSRLALVRLGHEKGMDAVADAWLPPMVHAPNRDDAQLMDGLRRMVGRSTPDSFERQQRALLTRPDALAVLAQIRCPTLVLVGRHDDWAPVAAHEDLAAGIAGARLVVVEEAGHMAPAERPDAVSAALLEWLLTVDRSAHRPHSTHS
jgi:pimeloyl-ACP methyl ester carboxylesterase